MEKSEVIRVTLTVLYADTLFLSNFVLNMLSLSLTGGVMHLKAKKMWLILASALGGIYSVIAVLCAFPGVLHILCGVTLSGLLVLLSFGAFRSFSLFLRGFSLFYFSTVLLGGGIEALFSVLQEMLGTRTDAGMRSSDLLLLLGFLAYFLIRGILSLVGGGKLPHDVRVRLTYRGKSVTVPLLVDSGCALSDPITAKDAILVSLDALRSVLPGSVLSAMGKDAVSLPDDRETVKRCRLLFAESVGGKSMLLAFRFDAVTLLSDGEELDVWVALFRGDRTRFGGCEGLLPAKLLYGRKGALPEKRVYFNRKKGKDSI